MPLTPRRVRSAARLTGLAAVGAVAQVAVDMPQGYFGVADRMTAFGAGYATGLTVLSGLLLAVLAAGRAAPVWTVTVVAALNVGLFIPAMASDPLIAGLVVLWNLLVLAQELFPSSESGRHRFPAATTERWLGLLGPPVRHAAAVSVALTIAVVGYRLSDRLLPRVVCLAFAFVILAAAVPMLWALWRQGKRRVALVVAPVLAAALFVAHSPEVTLALLAVAQTVLLVVLFAEQEGTLQVARDFLDNPSRLIAASFATAIAAGTVLLTFPAAAAREPIAALDAFFTATSATCVTGLIVLDTPHDFSLFGQVVILALIQVGGLGIMTLSTFAALLLGGSLGLRGERALAEILDLQTAPTAYRLTRFIVVSTLAIEAVGAVGLAASYRAAGLGSGEALWRGLFHAVSAFCNSGFALQSDSIVMFQESPVPVLLHAVLITLGGLGFVVLAAVGTRLVRPTRRPMTVQVRTVLAASAVLVIAGTVLYAVCEWERTLSGLPVADKLVNALFQSLTLRTAGFNTVDFTGLRSATALFMIVFMFVGASPGSTGGGIKTTTAVVLLAALRSGVGRDGPTRLFDREVPRDVVFRSLAIVVISGGVVVTSLFLLLLLEPRPFLDLLFEVTSAFATVGLSLGVTGELGPAGKLIIITLMFTGRIGPLTLALLLGREAARPSGVRFPETRLMVG